MASSALAGAERASRENRDDERSFRAPRSARARGLAGMGLAAGAVAGCGRRGGPAGADSDGSAAPSRRHSPAGGAAPAGAESARGGTGAAASAAAGAASVTARPCGDLFFMTATQLAAQLRSRAVSAREVMAAHLERIAHVNPKLNAIVAKLDDERCLELADEADKRAASGAPLPPLHGLPTAFKDLQPAVGFPYTRGSLDLQGRDADRGLGLRRAHARGGRDRDRQDERARVRHGLAHVQQGLRDHREPLRHDEERGRLERRRGRVARERHAADRGW